MPGENWSHLGNCPFVWMVMVAMVGPDGHGPLLALRICVLLPEIFSVPWGFRV